MNILIGKISKRIDDSKKTNIPAQTNSEDAENF